MPGSVSSVRPKKVFIKLTVAFIGQSPVEKFDQKKILSSGSLRHVRIVHSGAGARAGAGEEVGVGVD